ncbi:hypothetical protein FA13DRAFT_758897 [Coprinellus micaceus]|uniref:Tyrosinase copper-binding domain-containing protein n=1 Tax=Coprinellus micaceus TaxID=71717 RepID=A0A4Y7T3Q3_COPMI|nr:hypothetical protein FA13DRAFT_758897 [Coprinellus micaceus]
MSQPYNITGLEGVYPRREIRDLADDEKQFCLFIHALQAIKQPDYRPRAARFQDLGGIHGLPYERWSGDPKAPDALPEGTWGGYCNHQSVLFPAWHRPYVLAVEQSIGEAAIRLARRWIGDAQDISEEDRAAWTEAARALRFLFWDWTDKSTEIEGLPNVLKPQVFRFELPGSTQTKRILSDPIENPLAFHEFAPMPDGFRDQIFATSAVNPAAMSHFRNWGRTYRRPSSRLNPIEDYVRINSLLQCRALLYMLDYKNENGILGSEVKKSNPMIRFSIAAWTAKMPIVNDVYFNIELDARCPIIHFFSRLLFIDETRQEIFDLLYTPGKRFKRLRAAVVEATISRCRSLGDINRSKMEGQFAARISANSLPPPASGRFSLPRIVFKYFEHLLGIARQLCLHSDMRSILIKSTFLQDFVQGLQIWVVKKTDREGDQEERRHAFLILAAVRSFVDVLHIVNDPYLSSGDFWRSSAAASLLVIQGGYVSAVLEGMESAPPHDEEYRDTLTGCLQSVPFSSASCLVGPRGLAWGNPLEYAYLPAPRMEHASQGDGPRCCSSTPYSSGALIHPM